MFLIGNDKRTHRKRNMEIQVKLGQHIRKARQERGWSQEKLGEQCGIKRAQISKLERDVTHSSMDVFLKICEVLGFEITLRVPLQATETPFADMQETEGILRQLSPEKQNGARKKGRDVIVGTRNTKVIHHLSGESSRDGEDFKRRIRVQGKPGFNTMTVQLFVLEGYSSHRKLNPDACKADTTEPAWTG